ncbi:MAG: ATP-binding protein [Bacteroidota bacterium]|nr:ATP-binding protein [Bacteroidota bacterium]
MTHEYRGKRMCFAVLVRRVVTLVSMMLLGSQPLHAQQGRGSEVGIPLIKYFDTSTSGSYVAQNFSVGMDARGVMYFGNQTGLVEYDGVSWRTITTPGDLPVFSMERGDDAHLYIGGYGYFGRLMVDSTGKRYIEVLSDLLPETDCKFTRVEETHSLGGRICFRAPEGMYVWDEGGCRVIRADSTFRKSFVVNDNLYVTVDGKGLCVLDGEELRLFPGGERFADEERSLLYLRALDEHRLLAATWRGGFLLFDGGTWRPASASGGLLPEEVIPGRGESLADGSIAFCTGNQGVWILDDEGNVRLVLDDGVGLGNDSPGGLFVDDAQDLWVALDQGIARIEWPSPITRFVKEVGLSGIVTDMVRHDGTLYVTTTSGLFRLKPGDPRARRARDIRAQFEAIEGTTLECFDLCSTRYGLLVANPDGGLFRMKKNGSLQQVSDHNVFLIECVDEAGDTLLVATPHAFILMAYDGRTWRTVRSFRLSQNRTFNNMMKERPGIIWASTAAGVIYRLDFARGVATGTVEDMRLGENAPSVPVSLAYFEGKIRFITSKRMFVYDELERRFQEDKSVPDLITSSGASHPVVQDQFGRLWYQDADFQVYRAVPAASGLSERQGAPFAPLFRSNIYQIFVEEDGTAWFGGENVLYRYDARVRKSYRLPFNTLIRSVSTEERIWYNGNLAPESIDMPRLPYGHGPVRFSYAATHYGGPIYYYYRIPQRDTTWIGPSSYTEVVFRNFDEGEYRFEVYAESMEGAVSSQASFSFIVLPPWYRTWWAYLLYLLTVGLLILTGRLWYRTRYLRKRGEELEQTVRERTAEIQNKSREIHRQAEELERLDSIVRAVNRETKLPSVLDALLMQSLLFFPSASTALFVRRNTATNIFRVVAVMGRFADDLQEREFALRELLGSVEVSMERMREGVYVLSGLGERIAARTGDASAADMRFMAMSVQSGRVIEGFLVLGSQESDSFDPSDLQRLLRLKEHASSAVAKAGAIAELEKKNAELDSSNHQLIATQEQLVAQKKIAALGELTAGIAHEIQNPLNFVNNFSELSCELLDELLLELQRLEDTQNDALLRTVELVKANCEHIRQHGRRATSIVSAMLMHSRNGSSTRDNVPLNDLVDEFVMLSFHGIRLQYPQFQLDLQRKYDENVGKVQVQPQDLSRAIVNICNNAWEAAILKAAEDGPGAVPTVQVHSLRRNDSVHVLIRDNGAGIDNAVADRIFEPFFTTKRDSRNAGLGLSMSYEIITQLHRGELSVRSERGKFTEFEIILPASKS